MRTVVGRGRGHSVGCEQQRPSINTFRLPPSPARRTISPCASAADDAQPPDNRDATPSDLQKRIHRGARIHYMHGRPLVALNNLYTGLRLFPHDTYLLSLAASIESKLGNRQRAQQLLQTMAAGQPQHKALLTATANMHARCGEFEQARRLFIQAHEADPASAKLLQAWGVMEAAAGDLSQAREHFASALQISPRMPHIWCAWACMEAAAGDVARARELFQEAADVAHPHAPLLHAWAGMEAGQGRLSDARTLLQKALKISSRHLPSWMFLGRVEWMSGACEPARQTWFEGNSVCGPSAELLCVWARHELGAGGAQARHRARRLLRAALQADPGHVPSLRAADALEARAAGRGEERERERAVWLDTAPQSSAAAAAEAPALSQAGRLALLRGRAQHLLRVGDTAGAEQLLAQLEAEDGVGPLLCYMRGVLAVQEGRLADAAGWFVRGTAPGAVPGRAPDGALFNFEGLAEVHAFQGDAAAARATFAAGLRSCQRPTRRYLRQYAQLEKRLGNFDVASDLYRRAAQSEPQDPKTWLLWGIMERRRKHFEAAEECFRRGLAAAPNHPHLWYAYTTMQWRLGKVEQARELFLQATRLCPRNPPLWMEWALMERSQGDIGEARRLFECGTRVPSAYQHPPLLEAWARMEAEAGDGARAAQLMELASAVGAQKLPQRRRRRVAADSQQRGSGGVGTGVVAEVGQRQVIQGRPSGT